MLRNLMWGRPILVWYVKTWSQLSPWVYFDWHRPRLTGALVRLLGMWHLGHGNPFCLPIHHRNCRGCSHQLCCIELGIVVAWHRWLGGLNLNPMWQGEERQGTSSKWCTSCLDCPSCSVLMEVLVFGKGLYMGMIKIKAMLWREVNKVVTWSTMELHQWGVLGTSWFCLPTCVMEVFVLGKGIKMRLKIKARGGNALEGNAQITSYFICT